MNTKPLDFANIQGFVLSAYAHLDYACYLFLKITDQDKGRAWIKSLIPDVATAAEWPKGPDGKPIKPKTQVNIALTAQGRILSE